MSETQKDKTISRRTFLRAVGVGVGAAVVGAAAKKIDKLTGGERNQEDFLEKLGDPRQYFLEVSGKDIEPGQNYSKATVHESRGIKMVDVYGIVASKAYSVGWQAESGENYTFWQVDLAFPNRDKKDNSWSALPVTVWVDKAEEDIRRNNQFSYDVVYDRSFPYGDMGTRGTKLSVTAPKEDDSIKTSPEKFISREAYIKTRDLVLKEFEQGKGLVAPIIMSISDEGVEWEGEPSSFQKDEYYVYEWWKEGNKSLLEGCMKESEKGIEEIEAGKCSQTPGKVESIGRVISGVIVDLGW